MLEQLLVRTQIKLPCRIYARITFIGEISGIDEVGSNFGLDICVHFHSNGHEKGSDVLDYRIESAF